MKRRYHLLSCLAAAAACLLSLTGCEPEGMQSVTTAGQQIGQTVWADMPLTIAASLGEGSDTKASLLKDVEAKGTGALVLVFRSATRQLESYRFFSQSELAAQAQVPLSLRVPLADCDFYILGNLNGIRKSDGAVLNLMEALGAAFPADETGLESLVYRLDGGDLNGICRRETFAEVADQGIPYALIRKNVNTLARINEHKGIPDSDHCRRLFSKVTVRIDHAAFDGGGAHPEFFVNSRLYLRQANARLQPFSDSSQKAQEAADVLAQSDFDPDMSSTNASVTTFSFYVPENMQGTLLPGNTDSRLKTRDELLARNLSAVEPYLTYVEFCGQLDPAAGGYGGDVTYRFYVGNDNCSNFDLERGREYAISLTFRVGSLFDPDWKVEPDHWSDGRLFCLTADPGFTTDIGSVNANRLLAVRKSRPGVMYLYMNPQQTMGSTNLLLGKDVSASPNFIPADLSDCSWYGDLMKSGTEDAAWLAARGITASWDKTSGRLKLEVTDEALFNAHKGEAAREFTLALLPGGTVSTRFKIGLYDDLTLSVADGKSLTEDFYLGQKRTVSVSGFAGSAIKYAAVQEKCGASPSSVQNANVQWKAGLSGNFPGCAVDGAGRVLLDVSNAAYAAQTYTGSLDVYAFYPNYFQPGHSGWASKDGRIVFFSEDFLNDSMEVPLRISEPKLMVPSGNVYLPIDGNLIPTGCGYGTYDGSAALTGLDGTLAGSLLQMQFVWSASNTEDSSWQQCISLDAANACMYVSKTEVSAGKLEERSYSYSSSEKSYRTRLGTFSIYNPALPDLYPATAGVREFLVYVTKLHIRNISYYDPTGRWPNLNQAQNNNEVYPINVCYLEETPSLMSSDPAYSLLGGFGVRLEYYFRDAAIRSVTWEREGTSTDYTCQNSNDVIKPIINYDVEVRDTGEGGSILWLYLEGNQRARSSTGERVPGGLIFPYGLQTITGTYRNRWDQREFTVTQQFTIHHRVGLCAFVAADSSSEYAKVYLTTFKSAKYLKNIGDKVNSNARHWMVKMFGQQEITGPYSGNMYQKTSGTSDCWLYNQNVNVPVKNFKAGYVAGHNSATSWNASLISDFESSRCNIFSVQRVDPLSGFPQYAAIFGTNNFTSTYYNQFGLYVSGTW